MVSLGDLFPFNLYNIFAMLTLDFHDSFIAPYQVKNAFAANRALDNLLHGYLLWGESVQGCNFFFGKAFDWTKPSLLPTSPSLPVLPSRSKEDALLATDFEVCFEFVLAMDLTTFLCRYKAS